MPYSTQQQSLDRDIPPSLDGTASSNKAGPHAPSLAYDTPSPQQHSATTSISSSDYALKVIFSQFEHMADAKMSIILNMGVVKCMRSKPRRCKLMVANRSYCCRTQTST